MSALSEERVNGILLLYHRPLRLDAATILEHVRAFERHSQFKVWSVNTDLGFPVGLANVTFGAVVLHYSLFGNARYCLDSHFLNYLNWCPSYKIAFFQDEYRFCQQRFKFLNAYHVDCVYTLLEPECFAAVYGRYTSVPKLRYTLPGYVSEELLAAAALRTKPDDPRRIDIGYRARSLDYYMGRGAQEKADIGREFVRRVRNLGLCVDIEIEEDKRIYGDEWYDFISNCRGLIGVEAGVSIFDLEDSVRTECERVMAQYPGITFEEISEKILQPWEDNVYYRTISPRHFEAAAFRVCQILFEGRYSGILEPMKHYIPLKKDFSNFDEVRMRFSDPRLRHELTENCYTDLIASGKYSYKRFIEEFDENLIAEGFSPHMDVETGARVTDALNSDLRWRQMRGHMKEMLRRPFRGQRALRRLPAPVLNAYRRILYGDQGETWEGGTSRGSARTAK